MWLSPAAAAHAALQCTQCYHRCLSTITAADRRQISARACQRKRCGRFHPRPTHRVIGATSSQSDYSSTPAGSENSGGHNRTTAACFDFALWFVPWASAGFTSLVVQWRHQLTFDLVISKQCDKLFGAAGDRGYQNVVGGLLAVRWDWLRCQWRHFVFLLQIIASAVAGGKGCREVTRSDELIIIFINCNFVITRWQWLFYM